MTLHQLLIEVRSLKLSDEEALQALERGFEKLLEQEKAKFIDQFDY